MTLRPDSPHPARPGTNVSVMADETQDGSYEITLQAPSSTGPSDAVLPPAAEPARVSTALPATPSASSGGNLGLVVVAVALLAAGGVAAYALTRSPTVHDEAPPTIVAPEPVTGFQVYRVEVDTRRVIRPTLSPITVPDAGSASATREGSGAPLDVAPAQVPAEEPAQQAPVYAAPTEADAGVEQIDPAVIERIREVHVEIEDGPVVAQPIRRGLPTLAPVDAGQ